MKKTDGRIKYTKMAIRNSFLKQLEHTSLERITVKAVCDGAEINRATFYRHYSDCYDVIEEIETEMLEDLKSVLINEDQNDASFLFMLNRIREYGSTYILICSENGDRYFTQKILSLCYKQLKQKMHLDFPQLSETQREWLYSYMAHGCSGILSCWLKNRMADPPETISAFMDKLIQNTIQNL